MHVLTGGLVGWEWDEMGIGTLKGGGGRSLGWNGWISEFWWARGW